MAANFIDFVSTLVYGNLGAGVKNHMNWTLDRVASPPAPAVAGDQFLSHHLDTMLARYETWRSTNFLPPLTPWNGQDVFTEAGMPVVGPVLPGSLAGGPFPAGWTTNDLGNTVRGYCDSLRNFVDSLRTTELDDEVKAPFSFRYWAFMKWVADLRRRLLGQPVFPVGVVYDRDGTILSEKEFTDRFNQVHHVWHPDMGPPASWTEPTPFFKTGVGQHRRKRQISRAQVGAEFYAFHRDHTLLFDRWLARTKQDPVQSINMCAHDSPTPLSPPPAGLDVNGGGRGYPLVDYVTRSVDFAPVHDNIWDGSRAGTDGTLREFSSVGEMGQFFATDFNPFTKLPIPPGVNLADESYHGHGHNLNGDIRTPHANNYVPRFYAWHGFIDDTWGRRQPAFQAFTPADFPAGAPQVLTILRDLTGATDSVEPAAAVVGIDRPSGNGTLRCRIAVRPDPFNRPLELELRCEVLREAAGPAPVIALPPRTLTITVGPPATPNERQQGVDFVEEFAFDGSPGTADAGGKGPFATDNLLFPPAGPSATGFLNSLIRLTGRIVCKQRPDGTTLLAPGTLSSVGSTVTGSGTSFIAQTLLKDGDIIRAAGQVRAVTAVASNTSLTVLEPFAPPLPAGTAYEKLDGFDAEEQIEIPLLQEKLAPDVTVYLDHSSFSKDEVEAIQVAGKSTFENAFYLAIQDRTERPAPIAWPVDVEPALYGLIAPPARAAGLYADLAHAPAVELRDAVTNAAVPGVDVTVTSVAPEDPSLHPSVPQRVTYGCRVVFTGNAAFAGMVAGDTKPLKLVVTAVDRAGNTVVDDSSEVRLQVSANPYSLDGPTPWLSIDTRVFKVTQGQARFGVGAGWTNPNQFIKDVIDNLRAGNGTAGGESFDGLPSDQASAALEYSTSVGGQNVFNFALAKVRLQSVTGANDVRASFRLFRWGVANVAFDPTLAYRTHAPTGIAKLGRTTTDEVASIPFFAEPRVAVTASMTTQPDPKNSFNFGATGGNEAVSFYGAYLDINQPTVQFPDTFLGDGGFGAVPAASMRSIRDLLVSFHQCMVVEIVYPPDPTASGATPGSSDNLSQRNLLILRTANPGATPITRTVQHSFDIDLTRRRGRAMEAAEHVHDEPNGEEQPVELGPIVLPARPAPGGRHRAHAVKHAARMFKASWLAEDPEVVAELRARTHDEHEEAERWQFDLDTWKPTHGVDELVFFWNNLPRRSRVELYLPGAGVEEIVNHRNLRHAPGTVQIVDSHTLRLAVAGPTYLPIPPFWGDNLAGLVTVTLPRGTKAGQRFTVDVLQVRSDVRRVLGGFQLNIQVGKAAELWEAEKRLLEIFHERLSLTDAASRWRPILEREVAFTRERARGLLELANPKGVKWDDPTDRQRGQRVRVVLERIEAGGRTSKGVRVVATVRSDANGKILKTTRLADGAGRKLERTLFEGFVEDDLDVEVRTSDGACRYRRSFDGSPATWLGTYAPARGEPEDLGSWRLWYRIERA